MVSVSEKKRREKLIQYCLDTLIVSRVCWKELWPVFSAFFRDHYMHRLGLHLFTINRNTTTSGTDTMDDNWPQTVSKNEKKSDYLHGYETNKPEIKRKKWRENFRTTLSTSSTTRGRKIQNTSKLSNLNHLAVFDGAHFHLFFHFRLESKCSKRCVKSWQK